MLVTSLSMVWILKMPEQSPVTTLNRDFILPAHPISKYLIVTFGYEMLPTTMAFIPPVPSIRYVQRM